MTDIVDWSQYRAASLNPTQASNEAASHSAGASACNSLSTGLPFKRSKLAEALRDVLAIGSAVLLVSVTGLGISFAIFVLLFVKT